MARFYVSSLSHILSLRHVRTKLSSGTMTRIAHSVIELGLTWLGWCRIVAASYG